MGEEKGEVNRRPGGGRLDQLGVNHGEAQEGQQVMEENIRGSKKYEERVGGLG